MQHEDKQMRIETINTEKRNEAVKAMPWAAKIAKVSGGFMGFESIDDYKTWKGQK
jgi:hypothetical protein